KNDIFQLINRSNEDEEIYIDDDNFSSTELEIIDKNNDNKYLTESVDSSFYETEESEEEMNESEIANSSSSKKSTKKQRNAIHTQGSTTNFATHLLSYRIVKPQLAINKANNSQPKID
ncbi:7193_t:CDS:2, partial [Racocetra persica]